MSIVIPLYNQAEWLIETVSSVVAQSWTGRWEIIIVNDGSTDEGKPAAAARDLAKKYTYLSNREIRVVEKRNGGLADARNAGVRTARADWILPLDSDDSLGETFLAEAFSRIYNGTLGTRLNLVIANSKGFGTKNYHWNLPEYDSYDLRYSNMFHCSSLFRRELWENVPGGYPVATVLGYEDWAFWIAAEERVRIRADVVPEQLFFYRIRPDSMHQTLLKKRVPRPPPPPRGGGHGGGGAGAGAGAGGAGAGPIRIRGARSAPGRPPASPSSAPRPRTPAHHRAPSRTIGEGPSRTVAHHHAPSARVDHAPSRTIACVGGAPGGA